MEQFQVSQSDQILQSLFKVKSVWELLYYTIVIFDNVNWVSIIDFLTPLFRKDTFFKMVGHKNYYPQPTPNCRYYIKPNDGSCGKGIKIVNSEEIGECVKNLIRLKQIDNYTICPEICSPLITDNNGFSYKYDFRVWVGICSNLEYFICPTFIQRICKIPFDINKTNGSFTNTSLHSEPNNYQNLELYNKANVIVKDVLSNISHSFKLTNTELTNTELTNNKLDIMLTGWDFIQNESNDLFVLEVNCSPGINITHNKVMGEFLSWIEKLNKIE